MARLRMIEISAYLKLRLTETSLNG